MNNPVKEVLIEHPDIAEPVFFAPMNPGNRFNPYFLLILLSLSCILPTGVVQAQAPFLSATANKSTAGTDEQFQLTYTLNATGRGFQAPDLSDFIIHSGPNQSNSMQYINGNFSQSISISYILQPKKEGTFKIGPASIEVEGKRIVSNVVNMNVVKGAAQQPAAQKSESGLSNKNIFIKAVASKTNVYQGEAVVISFRIYTNVSILNYTVNKMPAFNGFFSQDIQLPEQLELTTEVIDGTTYRTGEIKKLVLFPQQSGELSIDPMELECIARIQVKSNRRDPFGMFQNDPFFSDPFFGGGARDVKYAFRSNNIKIQVRPLPDGAPAAFNGTVGKINYDLSVDKTTTKANEPITLKMKISGTGNLKLTNAPELNLPPEFEVYDPKITENIKTSASGSSGSKTFEYLIIPRNEGNFTIDAVPFSHFDLERKQYVTNPGKSFDIKVGRGAGQAVTSAGPGTVSQSSVQVIGQDIRYIKLKSAKFSEEASGFYGSTGFFILSISPILLVGGLLVYRNRIQQLNADQRVVRTRKATSLAQKRLLAASEALKQNEGAVVYGEISKALWGYVSDKLLIDPALLTKDTAAAGLLQRNVKPELVVKWKATMENCEMARYAGVAAAGSPARAHEDALQLITELENSLKS